MDFISAGGFMQDVFGQVIAHVICASISKRNYIVNSLYVVWIDVIGSTHS